MLRAYYLKDAGTKLQLWLIHTVHLLNQYSVLFLPCQLNLKVFNESSLGCIFPILKEPLYLKGVRVGGGGNILTSLEEQKSTHSILTKVRGLLLEHYSCLYKEMVLSTCLEIVGDESRQVHIEGCVCTCRMCFLPVQCCTFYMYIHIPICEEGNT